MTACTSMIALTAGVGLTFTVSSSAQDPPPGGWRGDSVVREAEETNVCTADDGVDSINSAYWESVYVPCYARWDRCKSYNFVLNVGDVRVGKSGGSYYSNPDTYFESGQCGWATPIEMSGHPLYVYVGNAFGMNFSCSWNQWVAIDFWVEEHSTMDCSGVIRRQWWDGQDCNIDCLDSSGYGYMAAYGIGDCAANEASEPEWTNVCHMPDVLIPNLIYQYSYKVNIQTWIYVDGSWQYGVQDSGCFLAAYS
ncbi:MAG: hypothetical protein JXB32_12115 [Deltaproteobacteria bacterium]|nr:hypothetical protein [Deltaproteobacteria bacterium]